MHNLCVIQFLSRVFLEEKLVKEISKAEILAFTPLLASEGAVVWASLHLKTTQFNIIDLSNDDFPWENITDCNACEDYEKDKEHNG